MKLIFMMFILAVCLPVTMHISLYLAWHLAPPAPVSWLHLAPAAQTGCMHCNYHTKQMPARTFYQRHKRNLCCKVFIQIFRCVEALTPQT